MGKEFALLFSVMFLPGMLTRSGAIDPSSWDSVYYHLTILMVAVPQFFLVLYVTELKTPGISKRLGWALPSVRDVTSLGVALVLGSAALTFLAVLALLLPGLQTLWEPTIQWSFTQYSLIPVVVLTSVVIGYREELFYRAYLTVRGEEMGLHPAVIICGASLLFAVGHLYQGWAGFITAFTIGATLGFVFVWKRSLHGIALVHGLYNAAVLLLSAQR